MGNDNVLDRVGEKEIKWSAYCAGGILSFQKFALFVINYAMEARRQGTKLAEPVEVRLLDVSEVASLGIGSEVHFILFARKDEDIALHGKLPPLFIYLLYCYHAL